MDHTNNLINFLLKLGWAEVRVDSSIDTHRIHVIISTDEYKEIAEYNLVDTIKWIRSIAESFLLVDIRRYREEVSYNNRKRPFVGILLSSSLDEQITKLSDEYTIPKSSLCRQLIKIGLANLGDDPIKLLTGGLV